MGWQDHTDEAACNWQEQNLNLLAFVFAFQKTME
jgi:hypothetical protein